jgi:hypothetical protein
MDLHAQAVGDLVGGAQVPLQPFFPFAPVWRLRASFPKLFPKLFLSFWKMQGLHPLSTPITSVQ